MLYTCYMIRVIYISVTYIRVILFIYIIHAIYVLYTYIIHAIYVLYNYICVDYMLYLIGQNLVGDYCGR